MSTGDFDFSSLVFLEPKLSKNRVGVTFHRDYYSIMNRTILRPVFAGAPGLSSYRYPAGHASRAKRASARRLGSRDSNDLAEGLLFLALSLVGLAAVASCLAYCFLALNAAHLPTL